ncbi:MAG: PGPGW domain-containing protein, partial [Gammaproteobacteria bacterium]
LGATTLIAVVAIIVLPGPAFIVIPAGIAILVIEYIWTRWWLRARGKEN